MTKPVASDMVSRSEMPGPPHQSETSQAVAAVFDHGADPLGPAHSVDKCVHAAASGGRTGTSMIRVAAFVIAIGPISLLGVAGVLEPNSQGVGTHQQLGLPPCSMRVLLGIRCPGCGMTTSWAHFTRGQFAQSVRVNSGGFLLAIFSILVALLALRTFWSAQPPSVRTQQYITLTLVAIALVTLMEWAIRLIG